MRILSRFVVAGIIGSYAVGSVSAQMKAPAELESLKPHEVVQEVLNFQDRLALTPEQVAELNQLHVTVRDEKHRYVHSGGKPHVTQHVAMITRGQAYTDAMAILSPDQRGQAVTLLTTLPETMRLPARLNRGKAHEVVEGILQERERLGLSEVQIQQLEALHIMIRDEKHRYSHRGGKPHQTVHQRMITREQAFAHAVAILTPEQRLTVVELFGTGEDKEER